MTRKNITTIEDLAQLIHETMASKEDIKEFRAEVKQKFAHSIAFSGNALSPSRLS
jgi:BMFP domain-containing protein YqiC